MKRTKFLKCDPCNTPKKTSKDRVVATSQILEIDGERAVEISLFFGGDLKGRYFADMENHSAWVDGKWYTCRLKNVVRLCEGLEPLKNDYYYCSTDMTWASNEEKERAQDFLDTWSIDGYEENLSSRKKQKAIERKIDRIDQQMADIPCVPEGAESWLEQEIFPGHILFIKKTGKRTAYTCTACGCSSLKKKGWKHGEKTICPKCGQSVTANSRQQEKTRTAPVVILQKYGRQWVERQFKAVCKWSAEGKEIQLFEQIRVIIPKGKCWGKVWYGTIPEADELEQDFWDRNPQNKRFLSSYLYPGNLQEVLPAGELELSGMDVLANKGRKFNVNKFITSFHNKPYLEYLAKAGLSRLTAEITDDYGWWGDPDEICTYAQSLQGALQLDGNRVSRMKQLDGGLCTLDWLQYEELEEVKIPQEALQYLTNKNLRVYECKEILKELKSVTRMVNYMKKQTVPPKKLVTTWRDYLRMAKEEGYNTEDDIVRLPKDLKARHDYLVELGNKRADEERLNLLYVELGAKDTTATSQPAPAPAKPSDESWKGNVDYYLESEEVRKWQHAMNVGFDLKGDDALKEDGKFGADSQAFAKNHNLWSGQKHHCPTAIKWLRRTLHDVYSFTKLDTDYGKWTSYLSKCVKVFQKNRGLTQDAYVGLLTTYRLLKG